MAARQLGNIRGSKVANRFSLIGATTLLKKQLIVAANKQSTEEVELQMPQPSSMNAFIESMMNNVQYDLEVAKKKLDKIQTTHHKKNGVSAASLNRVLMNKNDAQPTLPSSHFIDNMEKYQKTHKPRGAALSLAVIMKLDEKTTTKQDMEMEMKANRLAQREFQREIAHLRKGMSSLKTINLKKLA